MKVLKPEQIARLTREELERRIPRALERLQLLQLDLELENKPGAPMTPEERSRWRDRLKSAHRYQVTEYRRLKEALHKMNTSPEGGPVVLMRAALEILREVDDLSPDDLLVCHKIELWLSKRVRPAKLLG